MILLQIVKERTVHNGACKKFSRLHPGIVLSFCWSHQRRDFLTLANDYPPLAEWAMGWVNRVGELFKLYDERAEAVPRSPAYRQLHGKLRSDLRTMARERHRAARRSAAARAAAKALDEHAAALAGLARVHPPPGHMASLPCIC